MGQKPLTAPLLCCCTQSKRNEPPFSMDANLLHIR